MGTDAAFVTLGLAVGAQPIEITRAFRALSRASHPDHGGERNRFEGVLSAYRALQQAGLVPRPSPAASAARNAPASPPAMSCTVAARYRAFVRDLDHAAAMVVTPVASRLPSPARTTVRETSFSAHRFAEILERELTRNAA